jgi:tRNA modification GTPase
MERLVVSNKSDAENLLEYSGIDCYVSVKHGENMKCFIDKCAEKVALSDGDTYSKSVMVTERQKRYFDQIAESVEKLLGFSEIDFDIFEFELNSSLRLLSEITGLSYTEDILSNIFDNFCIGK